MKQKLLLKSMLLLFALIAGSSSVWATEVLCYTLEVAAGSDNGYATAEDIEINDITWNVTGNSTMVPWRLGGAKTTTFENTNRIIYSKTAISDNVTKIEITHGTSASITVNSMTVSVHNSADDAASGNNAVATFTPSYVDNGTVTITKVGSTSWAGKFYRIVYNLTKSANNKAGYILFSEAKFYTEVTLIDPIITFNDGSVRVGKTLDLSTLFDSNSAGAVTYSITAGDSYATIDGSTLTGVAVGDVTVQASQVAAGTYNAKTATATISVVDPALSSIAITTAPTKTTYDEGEEFDATGAVVTATFADASTEDVTASCTWTPTGALITSDTEVTVSYTYNAVTKTATQDITVNAYVQPTEFDIALKNSLFGTSYDGSVSGITDSNPVIGTLNHVTVTYAGSGNHYINDSQIRFYPNNKLTFEAPVGYVITKIVFTSGGTWAATIKSDKGTYTSDTKTWAGVASTVVFTGSGSSRCDMSKAAITLSNTATISLNAACTDGAGNYYGTYSSSSAFVVPSGLTVSALKVDGDGKLVVMDYAEGDIVKANTGVMVSATTAGDKTITLSSEVGTEKDGNLLKPSGDAGIDADGMSTAASGCKYYRLTMHNGTTLGFYWGAASGAAFALGANKAYLAVPAGSTAPEFFGFGGETTGINAVNGSELKVNGEYYNLAGQRVANPTKGLYIVNGKKVVIK